MTSGVLWSIGTPPAASTHSSLCVSNAGNFRPRKQRIFGRQEPERKTTQLASNLGRPVIVLSVEDGKYDQKWQPKFCPTRLPFLP